MASLNLVPDPELLVIQAGIFLANLVVVKKLMIDPYLRLKDKRLAMTTGGQEEAEKTLQECRQKSLDLERQVSEARTAAKVTRQEKKSEADADYQKTLAEAKKEASEYLDKLRGELSENLKGEREKIPGLVRQLTDEVYLASLR